MHRKRIITITELAFIYIKINLKISIGVWSTLPIFLPIYLHGSLQCHAQLTYPFIFIKLHVHSHNYFQKNKHVHSYTHNTSLVYLFISITGIVATPIPIHLTTSLVNKLETPIYTIYLKLANNGNKFDYKYIQAYVVNWEKSGRLHDKSYLF